MRSSANSSGEFLLPRPSRTVGSDAVARWLRENGLESSLRAWTATIVLQPAMYVPGVAALGATRFQVELEPDMWSLCFSHAELTSRIRVCELPTVDGRDDHNLLVITPQLRDLGQLLRQLERRHAFRFHRELAEVRSNHPTIKDTAQRWVAGL